MWYSPRRKTRRTCCRGYNLGANSYITKPVTFEGLCDVMRSLGKYWFEIVELPCKARVRIGARGRR